MYIVLNYPKDDIIFENRLATLLEKYEIPWVWSKEGITVSDQWLDKANELIEWLKGDNRS
jgi:hypothetical protein